MLGFSATTLPAMANAASPPSEAIQATGGAGLGQKATAQDSGTPIQRSRPRHRQANTIPR